MWSAAATAPFLHEENNCTDDALLRQVQAALGSVTSVESLESKLIDDRFDYMREMADFSFAPTDVAGVHAMARHGLRHSEEKVVVVDVQASGLNTSALCAFLEVGVPALKAQAKGFVVLSLGSASHGSPWHPSITNQLGKTCSSATSLVDVLLETKLRRWFVSQHYPASKRQSTTTTPSPGDPIVGDIGSDVSWVMHPKLHHVPLGVPRIFSKQNQREKAWLDLGKRRRISSSSHICRDSLLYVNFKPRPYRTAILDALRPGFDVTNHYVGKARVRMRDQGDTAKYIRDLATHKYALSPAGSGIDCYRHYEALLCGAIPVVEYSPLAVELLSGLPAIFVRNWNSLTPEYLDRAYHHLISFSYDFSKLTPDYWQHQLLEAISSSPFILKRSRRDT